MSKSTVVIRQVTFGEGRAKICVPLTSGNREEMEQALDLLEETPYDLVEWRADYYEGARNARERRRVLQLIREKIGDRPLLFTWRSWEEGGRGEITSEEYRELLLETAEWKIADLLDVELFTAGEQAGTLASMLQEQGAVVLGSNHDFEQTPETEEMIRRLCRMQECGMDMTKLAVMPRNREDVLRLLTAAVRMEEKYADRPCVTMSMGKLGVISRIADTLTGSAITFGFSGTGSAPGQLPADSLHDILNALNA